MSVLSTQVTDLCTARRQAGPSSVLGRCLETQPSGFRDRIRFSGESGL